MNARLLPRKLSAIPLNKAGWPLRAVRVRKTLPRVTVEPHASRITAGPSAIRGPQLRVHMSVDGEKYPSILMPP